MKEKLQQLKAQILDSLKNIKDAGLLRELEIKILGRKGELTDFLRGIANLNEEEKKTIGKLANEIKSELAAEFDKMKNVLVKKSGGEDIDVTLPGEKIERGHLHPITIVQNELEIISG